MNPRPSAGVLLEALGEKFGAYVITSLLTGMRPEEARKLLWDAVVLKGKLPSISVLRADRGTEPARTPNDWRPVRRGGTRPRPPRDDGTMLDPMRGLRAITKKAGIGTRWKVRELRHSFVSILSDGDVSVERIADLVGHSTRNTTQTVYRHQIRPVIVHGAETMDAVFGNGDHAG
ncbi:tyrosine-type recombinase/integrase [Nonomuraea sp. NN258]|uniref:tyrosine-type recombinase/integrase n=1 Tax=Nonomuraea antri TaxID=2730852 RepID=UPI00156846CC|nr:tyrosine-type recombinase/integrase [Nonomuraea antri]NRQ32868.1 tyrosine-type recombinase/integrase [Nonomuraea antri]